MRKDWKKEKKYAENYSNGVLFRVCWQKSVQNESKKNDDTVLDLCARPSVRAFYTYFKTNLHNACTGERYSALQQGNQINDSLCNFRYFLLGKNKTIAMVTIKAIPSNMCKVLAINSRLLEL